MYAHIHICAYVCVFMKGIYVDVCKKHRACQEAYKSKYYSASRNCQTQLFKKFDRICTKLEVMFSLHVKENFLVTNSF